MPLDINKVVYWNASAIWQLEGDTHPSHLLEILALLSTDATLFFEGNGLVRPARELFRKHVAKRRQLVTHDTVFPISYGYHVLPSIIFQHSFARLQTRFKCYQLFHHVKAYNTNGLLLWYHDACDAGSLVRISKQVTRAKVLSFANAHKLQCKSVRVRTRSNFIADTKPFEREALRRD